MLNALGRSFGFQGTQPVRGPSEALAAVLDDNTNGVAAPASDGDVTKQLLGKFTMPPGDPEHELVRPETSASIQGCSCSEMVIQSGSAVPTAALSALTLQKTHSLPSRERRQRQRMQQVDFVSTSCKCQSGRAKGQLSVQAC